MRKTSVDHNDAIVSETSNAFKLVDCQSGATLHYLPCYRCKKPTEVDQVTYLDHDEVCCAKCQPKGAV